MKLYERKELPLNVMLLRLFEGTCALWQSIQNVETQMVSQVLQLANC